MGDAHHTAKQGRVLVRLVRDSIPGHARALVVAFACMALVAASAAGVAWLMKDAVNEVLVRRDPAALVAVPAAILLLAAVKGFADYGQMVLVARIGNAIAATFQKRLFRKILGFDQAYFDAKLSSRIATRLNNNTRAARGAFVTLVTSVGRDALTVVALVAVMALHDPTLAVLAAVVTPVVMIGLAVIGRKVKALSRAELEGSAVFQGHAQETFQGIRTVRAFALEPAMTERFDHAVDQTRQRGNALARLSAMTSPFSEVIGGLVIAGTILLAGWGGGGVSSPGEVMSFITAFLLAFEPAKRLMNAHVSLLRNLAVVSKMYQMLDRPDPATPAAVTLGKPGGELSFRSVTFGYGASQPVLREVSFEARPGEMVALVGRSGVGKSTVFALLQRLYEPDAGRIEIGGTDITRLASQDLRAQFSVVSQNTTLFSTTIGENIRMARPGASDEEVRAAARAAAAFDFINALPAGLDTEVGEQGLTLSGGQVQRISIARAILRDAPILLLDEATAALDAETAEEVQASVMRLVRSRTTLVIAHRPAMITAADRVVVLTGGQVSDIGSPTELQARSAEYRRLVSTGDLERS